MGIFEEIENSLFPKERKPDSYVYHMTAEEIQKKFNIPGIIKFASYDYRTSVFTIKVK